MIQNQLYKIENFITCFEDYGQVRNDRLKIRAINFGNIISELLSENELILRYPHVRYQIDLLKAQRFYSDKTRIRIILRHMLTNAFYFSSMSDDAIATFSIESNDLECILKVNNKGSFMQGNNGRHNFLFFFYGFKKCQVSSAGMFLVKQAVCQLRGSLNFINSIETGNTIQIKLPNFNTI